jgi:NAD(P)-dependent dehydrogenase (short-subunit alcohol dehydrogenase family)
MGAALSHVHGEVVAGLSLIAWAAAALTFGLPTTSGGWACTVLGFVWWQRYAASGFASPFVITTRPPFAVDREPAGAGRVVVVTGANSGIGRQTVVLLLRAGYRVVLSCRTKMMAAATMQAVAAEAGVPLTQVLMPIAAASFAVPAPYRLASIEMELDDLSSVRAAAAQTAQVMAAAFGPEARLYCLVNNAGALAPLTASGAVTRMAGGCRVERNIGINFVAPLLLYDELKARGVFAPGARVIHTSSVGHFLGASVLRGATGFRYALNHACDEPIPASAIPRALRFVPVDQFLYCMSKLGTSLTATGLAREGGDVQHVALHPGMVSTAFFRASLPRFVPPALTPVVFSLIMKTPTEGAYTTLRCVTAPSLINGAYYADSVLVKAPFSSPVAADPTLAAEALRWARDQARSVA